MSNKFGSNLRIKATYYEIISSDYKFDSMCKDVKEFILKC